MTFSAKSFESLTRKESPLSVHPPVVLVTKDVQGIDKN